MIAYCGLNCSKCDAYLATQENDEMKREETAKKWSKMYRAEIKADQINWNGCKSNGVKFFHCNNCDIRACCLEKGVGNCAACEDYICKTLSEFITLAPEAGRALAQLRI
jgi:hypothetical protein